jgi:PEP-CTERM motif-containing protein
MTSVDWSITSAENGGTVYGSGRPVAKTSLTQLFPPISWLNLQNAAVPSGDSVFGDENSGKGCRGTGCPSSAWESAVGTIPSEAFTIGCGGSTPEPSSIMLFGSGILGLAGVLRRKLF